MLLWKQFGDLNADTTLTMTATDLNYTVIPRLTSDPANEFFG